jgi:hypothetical protein
VEGGEGQAERIRELTGGRGVDAAFDFVGAAPTIAVAQASIAQRGAIQIVGIACGTAQWSFFSDPSEATLSNSYCGTIEELYDVAALYRAGAIALDVERFAMEDALEAYRRLRDGELDAWDGRHAAPLTAATGRRSRSAGQDSEHADDVVSELPHVVGQELLRRLIGDCTVTGKEPRSELDVRLRSRHLPGICRS